VSTFLQRQRVAVFPDSSCHANRRLLDSLAALYPVDFVPQSEAAFDRMDAAIFFSEDRVRAAEAFERGMDAFVFSQPSGAIELHENASVTFSNETVLHPAFANARVPLGGARRVAELPATERDCTLASRDSLILWLVRSNAKAVLHTVALGPPELREDELLWSYLQPQNWLGLLPLLHFLQRLTAPMDWSPCSQRACFMFDDPNLHSLRYGHLNFAAIARQAKVHNYHVALATVPLDAWYAARKPVELFHKHPESLSLLIHGNDHVRNEFAQDYGEGEALRILAQALTRIAGLELRTGLKVSRVLAAPHGGCSESMMAQMLRLPLDGACVSVMPTIRCNPRKVWPLDFGLSPVCFMAGGFPVIRRFHLRYGLPFLRFAAFLGQPIVAYGHHEDCADGLGRLADVADTVNGWGTTDWTDPESIFTGHYRTRREDSLLHVKMCARRVRVTVPEGVSHVLVERPDGCEAATECKVKLADTAEAEARPWASPFPVVSPTKLKVSISLARLVDPATVGQPGYRVWPSVRRALSVGRDRVAPVLRSVRASTVAARP
jgi:hypothetical protein